MAIFDNGFKLVTGLALGVGAILLSPVVIPAVTAIVKPLVKTGIKGGILLYEKSIESIAEAKEMMEDLAAEAQAELAKERQVMTVTPSARSAEDTAGEMAANAS